jgi:hypothetical protein
MISVLNSNARSSWVRVMVDQNKDYAIGVCSFSTMYAFLKDKKEWWARYHDKLGLGYGV